jgi:hypothetical protein
MGQHAVDPSQRYHRLICLVHLTGSGKHGDPIRPEFVPGSGNETSRDGIIAWTVQTADDGKMAIVHLVAIDAHAFDAILADKRPEIRVFEIGKDNPAVIEAEMKRFKKDFTLDSLKVVAR